MGRENGSNKQSTCPVKTVLWKFNKCLTGVRYFNIAKGSSAEVQTQAIISYEIGYLDKEDFDKIYDICRTISKKLTKLIQYRFNHL